MPARNYSLRRNYGDVQLRTVQLMTSAKTAQIAYCGPSTGSDSDLVRGKAINYACNQIAIFHSYRAFSPWCFNFNLTGPEACVGDTTGFRDRVNTPKSHPRKWVECSD